MGLFPIINHIDNLMIAIEVAVKVAKFVARVLHLLMLVIGYVAIGIGVGVYLAYQHWSGKQTAQVDVTEAEHGPVPEEFAEVGRIHPNEMYLYTAADRSPRAVEWQLDAEEVVSTDTDIVLAQFREAHSRKRRKAGVK